MVQYLFYIILHTRDQRFCWALLQKPPTSSQDRKVICDEFVRLKKKKKELRIIIGSAETVGMSDSFSFILF